MNHEAIWPVEFSNFGTIGPKYLSSRRRLLICLVMTAWTRLFEGDRRRNVLGVLTLSLLGILGNAFPVSLFFGVDILFGSIAGLVAIVWLGPRCGLLVTAVTAAYTYVLWNHPYAAVVFIGEGLFVALLLSRLRGNLALSSTLYWIVIGIPLHAVLYHRFLQMDALGTELATIKQATSGIFNSILASLVISYWPLLPFSRHRADMRIPLFQNIFHIFVVVALIPAALMLVYDARVALRDVERSARARLETVASGVSQATEGWLRQQQNAVTAVTRQIERSRTMDPRRLQPMIEGIRPIWTDFHGAFITDHTGRTLAFDPLVNTKGESTLGINFSDRFYFQTLRDGTPSPYISDVFLARGGVFEPVFNVASAIRIDGEFRGIVAGSLNLQNMIQRLHDLLKDSVFQATLVDRAGRVIASDNPEYPSLSEFSPRNLRYDLEASGNFFYRTPNPDETAPMARWNNSFLGMQVLLKHGGQWNLYIEQPLSPMRAILYQRYIRNMAYLLGLVLVIQFGSMVIAGRIARPLAQLSVETTNLASRLERQESVNWPKTHILEFNTVTENFISMSEELKRRFAEIEASRNQLKEAKDDAETANRMKSSFLANMSHEIRTPLGIMVGFTDLLIDEHTGAAQRAEFAKGLKRNATQLSLLIDDILDLSKVEAGHLAMEFSEFSLARHLRDLVADFGAKGAEKGLRIELHYDPSVGASIVSDPDRLKQILVNLLGNAVKFTQEGVIELRVDADESWVHIDVTDHGIGIAPTDQEKLFRPFSQADDSLTRKFGGTGLGLALSKRLASLLGGDLILLHSDVGQGATFRLSLPRRMRVAASPMIAPEDATSGVSNDLSGRRILLVEDSPDNQALITHLLERAGAKVDVASDGAEGVDRASKSDYDFVLMDLQMPVMDGLTAAKILRERGYRKPLIALTAHAMSEFRVKCFEAGFDEHVSKPIHIEELMRALQNIEGHSRASQDLTP